jgi:hypothetical protein
MRGPKVGTGTSSGQGGRGCGRLGAIHPGYGAAPACGKPMLLSRCYSAGPAAGMIEQFAKLVETLDPPVAT